MFDETVRNQLLASAGTHSVFDGHRWHAGDARGTHWVTPALVDFGCGVAGYRESLMDPLLRAARAITSLLDEAGIRALRISSCSWAEYWNVRAVASSGLQITGGGPYLVLEEPDSDRQRWVRSPRDLASAADLASAEGVGWLPLQTTDASFADAGVRAARERGLRVALRGNVGTAVVLGEGDLFVGLGNLTRRTTHDPALQVLSAWADDSARQVAVACADRLLTSGVIVTSELLNLHRTVFVRDSLEAPFLEENEPILPHVRWLLQMRRGAAYFGGRGTLAEHTGLAEPSRAESKVARQGWDQLVATAARLFDSGLLCPASTSPQLTQLPGFGLKEELAVLHGAGVGIDPLLHRATDPTPLGLAQGPVALASTTAPSTADVGRGARFLMSLRPVTIGGRDAQTVGVARSA